MGNAMTAVTGGDVVAYYNPALIPGAGYRFASASFGILSLDRRLNFLNYSGALPPSAGLSIGLINAGVSEIDGRDGDGEPTGPLKTSENQLFLGFGVRFPFGLSVGVTLKLLYYQLYTDVSSTTVGVDFGALYRFDENLTAAITVKDINSRYKWDTRPVFGQNGLTSEEAFPLLYTAGAAFRLPDSIATRFRRSGIQFSRNNHRPCGRGSPGGARIHAPRRNRPGRSAGKRQRRPPLRRIHRARKGGRPLARPALCIRARTLCSLGDAHDLAFDGILRTL